MSVESLGNSVDYVYDACMAFEREVSFFDMLQVRFSGTRSILRSVSF